MKHIVLSFVIAIFTLGMMVPDADARRFGGGGNFGMQRQATPQQQPRQPAQQQPNRQQQAGSQNRSPMMGMIGGLAAGLGLAALFSYLGLGEEFASLFMIALLLFAGFMLFRFLSRRVLAAQQAHDPMQFAGSHAAREPRTPGIGFTSNASAAASGQHDTLAQQHPDFDAVAFERQAKLNFIRLQAAYDKGDLVDIREFTTPEVFAEIRMQLADAPTGPVHHTDIVDLNAEVIDVAEEAQRFIVSVRFNGMLREEEDTPPTWFDEIWHLTKDREGHRGWMIAGIQQVS